MKPLYLLFSALALLAIACGQLSTLPTTEPAREPVKSRQLSTTAPVLTPLPTTAQNWRVNCATLNVRQSAGMSAPVIGDALQYGSQVVIVGMPVITPDGASWVEVATPENGGLVGWVNFRYLVAVE